MSDLTDTETPVWTATFRDGTRVIVREDDWTVDGSTEVEQRVEDAAAEGWPELAGWQIDTSPGWDPQWMYLRLLALGADEVTGPFPQADQMGVDPELDEVVG